MKIVDQHIFRFTYEYSKISCEKNTINVFSGPRSVLLSRSWVLFQNSSTILLSKPPKERDEDKQVGRTRSDERSKRHDADALLYCTVPAGAAQYC